MSNQQIRLLMFSNATSRGGAEEHLIQILSGLDRRIFHVHLCCTAELAKSTRADLPDDVGLCVLDLDDVSDLGGAYKFRQYLQHYRIGIVHCHMFRSSLFAGTIARFAGVPIVVQTCHGNETWRTGWKASSLLDRTVTRNIDYLIAVSQSTARALVTSKGIPARKITIIRSAVDACHFHPDYKPPVDLLMPLGFDSGHRLLVVAGRLEPQKGHTVLLEAMPLVLKEFPEARLICLSDGSLRSQLQSKVDSTNLGHAVRFVGYQPDVRDWFAVADVTVLPSWYEGLPLAPLEALASGRPIVATAVDGTPEVVIDGVTGLLVHPGDAEGLANAIRRVLRNPPEARQMALAGRKHVLQNFTVDKLVHDTQEFYCAIWQRHVAKAGHNNESMRCEASPARS